MPIIDTTRTPCAATQARTRTCMCCEAHATTADCVSRPYMPVIAVHATTLKHALIRLTSVCVAAAHDADAVHARSEVSQRLRAHND